MDPTARSSQGDPVPRGLLAGAGARLRLSLARLGSVAWLAGESLRALLSLRGGARGIFWQTFRNQVRFTALDALPLVSVTALLLGGVALFQALGELSGLGLEAQLSQLMALLVVRELGPVLVAILVVGRSGTAIAAEMASMKLDGEVDTLWATGVDPIAYLLAPRLAAGVVSLLVLVVLFDAVALVGGFAVASLRFPLSLRLYLSALEVAVGPAEVAGTFLKAASFGLTIPLVACHSGLRLSGSPTEIPQAVTRATVESMLAIFVLSAIVSVVCYA